MITPDEFKNKSNVSYGLIFFIGFICFNLGILYATLLGAKDDIIDNRISAQEFTEQEVGGLRSDWDRQNKAFEERLKLVEMYHWEDN